MTFTAALNVALNGVEAGVTSKTEAKELVFQSIADMLRDAPIDYVEHLVRALGASFEMNDGRLSAVHLG